MHQLLHHRVQCCGLTHLRGAGNHAESSSSPGAPMSFASVSSLSTSEFENALVSLCTPALARSTSSVNPSILSVCHERKESERVTHDCSLAHFQLRTFR